jgi:hypothetical protein
VVAVSLKKTDVNSRFDRVVLIFNFFGELTRLASPAN